MANPVKRHSRTRGRKRRTHWKISAPNVVRCSNCSGLALPHHICPHCGYYDGRAVISVKEA